MAGIERSVSYRIIFDLSDDHLDIAYESETSDQFATVSLGDVTIRASELDGLIDGLMKIRDEVKAYEANDAVGAAAKVGTSG